MDTLQEPLHCILEEPFVRLVPPTMWMADCARSHFGRRQKQLTWSHVRVIPIVVITVIFVHCKKHNPLTPDPKPSDIRPSPTLDPINSRLP